MIMPGTSFYQWLLVGCLLGLVLVEPETSMHPSCPIVRLPYGSFQGKVIGNLVQYLGIPFAAPPIAERRFRPPEPPLPVNGIRQATAYGAACPQQNVTFNIDLFGNSDGISAPSSVSEDCLFINIVRPANVKRNELLPIIFYIFGGGFQLGDTSFYRGDNIVNRSIALDEPVIYVSANYRLNAFGFLGGKEVKEAGIANAGLYDQRFALQWVQSHISAFGGDPKKVTIWGESAGSRSVGLQLLLNNGDPSGLFTGSIMESGFPSRLPDVLDQQKYFDGLVHATNCAEATDRLACLQKVSYPQLMAAVNLSPNFLSYQGTQTWQPMVDGKLIESNPLLLVESGKYAKVPLMAGDCEDEGTLFSLSTLNITTNDEFLKYIKEYFFPRRSDEEITALAKAYPDDVTQGSPFDTGTANAITPQFKRFSALKGDMLFQAPRRFLLEKASKTQAAYAYRYMRGSSTPVLGAGHGTDIPEFLGLSNQIDFIAVDSIIFFAKNRDPNAPENSISLLKDITWEKWASSQENPPLLTFVDPAPKMTITSDTFRSEAMKLLIQLLKK